MSKTLIVIRHGFIIGGTLSLTLRMFQWCFDNTVRTIWIKSQSCHTEQSILDQFRNVGTEIIEMPNIPLSEFSDFTKIEKLSLFPEEEVTIITYNLIEFYHGERIKKMYPNILVNNFFYVVHPYVAFPIYYENIISTKKSYLEIIKRFISKINKFFFRTKILEAMCRNKSLIFPDAIVYNTFVGFYKFPLDPAETKFIPLGMRITEYQENIVINRKLSPYFNILSVSRFDIPFKGYLLGLIESYNTLKIEYPNIKLIILGYGDGEFRIKNEISKLPKYIQRDIELVGKTSYEKLSNYFAKTQVYVGTGTSILDAANTGLISVIASTFQEENYSCGFFHDNPHNLGAPFGEKGSNNYRFTELLERVYLMDSDEYLDVSKKTHYLLSQYYDIDVVMNGLLLIKNKEKRSIISQVNFIWFKFAFVVFQLLLFFRKKFLRKSRQCHDQTVTV